MPWKQRAASSRRPVDISRMSFPGLRMYVCVLGNMYWVYRFHGPYVLEEYLFHMNMTLYWMCRFHRPYMSWEYLFHMKYVLGVYTVSLDPMSWGVPFSYEICTGCTVSIYPRLCVCILGVLPQDMETVEYFGSDLKCCYLTVEINTYMSVNTYFWPNSQHLTLNPVT